MHHYDPQTWEGAVALAGMIGIGVLLAARARNTWAQQALNVIAYLLVLATGVLGVHALVAMLL